VQDDYRQPGGHLKVLHYLKNFKDIFSQTPESLSLSVPGVTGWFLFVVTENPAQIRKLKDKRVAHL